ncbi:period circadian protein homolog 1 [Salmo trutta]|uniref:Period circadian clock 1a n=1 Tax=Salmo trutta TaxID=8032 RepID=A0A673ZVG7_SALTR|nr:period circadian protein homolog 1-like [Salmo trutta]XP_029556940.1 period circadian protein homolog 1-like [Salmo trutta]
MSDENAYTTSGNDTSGVSLAEDAVAGQEAGPQSPESGLTQTGSSNGNGKRTRSGGKSSPKSSNSDDTDAQLSGNDSAEREVEGHMGHEASTCSSSHNGKGSAMETNESKSSNSQSTSPPNSSMVYSLLSGSSELDHPSTSGCSSGQPARLQTQRELLKALKELKIRMPADHRTKGRSSTLASLQYALNCVKQVRANQEYYHQWSVEESHGCSLDLSAFTTEELDNITSEYTLQNTDTFSVGVSFLSGKVVYISPQASPMLCTKPERLQGALFSELLAPQDVSTFYSSTAPCRLPPWASCTGSMTSPVDCTQEKSMFCRISGGRDSEGEVRYYPFRMTPYQLTLRDSDMSQPQPCCLLIAEKVHSGYEAPRIPADKRIFTTSHTPSCLFQEVDERAVPLLGYLPQDLVGTPVLMYLHPDDRPVMVAIHKKILQSAGQPFEHSPLRMCARNGEYLTIDTSWSSFVNPWSRKVAFIVGRHKVRTSPLNEDVFTPTVEVEARTMSPEIPRLSEQIHRVLVQPVHSGGSQGYCSSHGSHPQRPSPGSSSGSNSPSIKELILKTIQRPPQMTFQQMCKDVHMVKTSGQQVFTKSRNRPALRKHASTGALVVPENLNKDLGPIGALGPTKTLASVQSRKDLSANYSYQQINCLDSIVRYLESCNVPNTVKRKCGSSSCTTSSTSDDDKQRELPGTAKDLEGPQGNEGSKGGPQMSPLTLHCKAESVVSVTSQCSFSSTIVHVGDKKPPESDIVMMETPATPTLTVTSPATATNNAITMAVTPRPLALPSPAPPSPAQPERDGRRSAGCSGRLGLTKEVLSAHTQQEEQVFLSRFRDLGQLCVLDPGPPSLRGHTITPKGVRSSKDYPAGGHGRRRGRGGKRLKHQKEGSQRGMNGSFRRVGQGRQGLTFPMGQPLMMQGPLTSSSSWPTSVASEASLPPAVAQYPPGVLPFFPLYPSVQQVLAHTGVNPNAMQMGYPSPQPGLQYPMHANQMPMPMAPPMMVVLPNYMFPQLNGGVPQLHTAMPQYNTTIPHLCSGIPGMAQLNQALPQFKQTIPLPQLNPGLAQFNPALTQMNGMPRVSPALAQLNPSQVKPTLSMISQHCYDPSPALPFPNPIPIPGLPGFALPEMDPTFVQRGNSRSSTPQSTCQAPLEETDSPLFQSRCSSPLNLLQLEELPGNRQEGMSTGAQQTLPPPGSLSQFGGQGSVKRSMKGDAREDDNDDADDQDAMSTSSDLLDLLLQEDACSGTGSAASGSSGSGSNGCSTSGSGTRSSNTSKYFGSVDSSENDHSHKQAPGGAEEAQLMKYVLQDPIWLLMANTDDKVMMTYQMPTRDKETVLREDGMILRAVQKQQPRFTEAQKRELIQVHPWMGTGRLPQAINSPTCTGCGSPPTTSAPRPFNVELQDMDLTGVLQLQEETPVTMATETHDTSTPQAPQTVTKGGEGERQREQEGDGKDTRVKELEVTSSSGTEKGDSGCKRQPRSSIWPMALKHNALGQPGAKHTVNVLCLNKVNMDKESKNT